MTAAMSVALSFWNGFGPIIGLGLFGLVLFVAILSFPRRR